MITIITGGIGSGKSTLLKQFYEKQGGAGFYLAPVLRSGRRHGQDLVWLPTGERVAFSRRLFALPRDWQEAAHLPGYSFSREGQQFLDNKMPLALAQRGPLYVDEIGPLELGGFGYGKWMPHILAHGAGECILCIRRVCLKDVCAAFALQPGHVIQTDAP